MTSTNGSSGHMPTEETKPNWTWLQARIDEKNGASQLDKSAVTELDDWFECQLADLEQAFAQYITPKSLTRDLKRSR